MRQKLIDHFNNIIAVYKAAGSDNDPPMPIEAQVDYLIKKNLVFMTHDLEYPQTDADGQQIEPEIKNKVLLCFNNVIVKYRPHLHMGDYWLDVEMKPSPEPVYRFYSIAKLKDGDVLTKAQHPHLHNGAPCMGSFGPEVNTALKEFNFIRFYSQMRAYLGAYYGRSVYQRGSVWRKANICWSLYSTEDIRDTFAPEVEEPERLDIHELALDPMRWNFPKNIAARGSFVVQGQERTLIERYIRGQGIFEADEYKFPYFNEHNYRNLFGTWSDNSVSKLWGYVYLCMEIGEMSLMHALEFTRIFMLTLWYEFTGDFDHEKQKRLQEMTNKLNRTYSGKWNVNTRYSVNFVDTDKYKWRQRLQTLVRDSQQVGDMQGVAATFMEQLKEGGHKIGNFIVLIRKGAPNLAKMATFLWTKDKLNVDHDGLLKEYDELENHAYKLALSQLEKDKRRFVNEINKSKTNNTIEDGGQGSLFS